MSSVELWFDSDSEDEERREELLHLAHKRQKLRDASNPLEINDEM